jgi:acyl-CoA thioester hydrolase
MPFAHLVDVVQSDIDNLGHASNLVYLRWVQDAALAHSTALGFSEALYLARGQVWVVRKHEIEYLRPAVAGDRLRVETRVATMKAANSVRMTEIFRAGELLCRALTDWVYVDLARGRPLRIPEELRAAFPLEPASNV